MPNFNLTYAGVVEAVDGDPKRRGRIKARVPMVYGPATGSDNSIKTADIPWANPAGLPAGGSQESGAVMWVPNVGDPVYVRFLDGEPEKPIWEWGTQSDPQAVEFPYFTRDPGGYGPAGEAPQPALITRHGHQLELAKDTLMLRTASGYKLRFTDSTGQLDVYVPTVKALVQDAVWTGQSFSLSLNDLEVSATTVNVKTTTLSAEAITATITAALAARLDAPHVELGPNGKAVDPVVRLSDVKLLVQTLVTQFNAHLHIGNLGKPTSPPIVPMVLVPTGSSTSFTA